MQIKIICLLLILSACNNGDKTPGAASATNLTDSATAANPSTSAATGNAADAALKPAMPPADFKDQYATVNGVKIHYVIGGTGEPLLLVHGFGQNWYMWNRLLPGLSKHFTVIAADLRGVGESEKPLGDTIRKQWRRTCMS